jgi:hypothetical protein
VGIDRDRPERQRRRARGRRVRDGRAARLPGAHERDHVVDAAIAEPGIEARHQRTGAPAVDRVPEEARARAGEEVVVADVEVRAAGALRSVALHALAREDVRAARRVPGQRSLVEHGGGPLLPLAQRRDDRVDLSDAERTAAQPRPGGHRRAAATAADRVAKEVVAHGGEEVLVRERRRLVRRVALSRPTMADRAHARVEHLSALRLGRGDDAAALERAAREAREENKGTFEKRSVTHAGGGRPTA